MKLSFACLGLCVLTVASLADGRIVRPSLAEIESEGAKIYNLKPLLDDKPTDGKRDLPVGEKPTPDNKQDDTIPTSDDKPADTKSDDTKPTPDNKQDDTKPTSDDKPADTKPDDTTKPTSDDKPADTKPVHTNPASDKKPTDTKPDAPSNDQPADDNVCATANGRNLKNPESGQGFFGWWHCMTYTQCKDKTPETEHCLGWPLIPLKQYSPSAQSCQWFWNVRCGEADSDPK